MLLKLFSLFIYAGILVPLSFLRKAFGTSAFGAQAYWAASSWDRAFHVRPRKPGGSSISGDIHVKRTV